MCKNLIFIGASLVWQAVQQCPVPWVTPVRIYRIIPVLSRTSEAKALHLYLLLGILLINRCCQTFNSSVFYSTEQLAASTELFQWLNQWLPSPAECRYFSRWILKFVIWCYRPNVGILMSVRYTCRDIDTIIETISSKWQELIMFSRPVWPAS